MDALAKALELVKASDSEVPELAPLICQQAQAYAAIAQAEAATRQAAALERMADALHTKSSDSRVVTVAEILRDLEINVNRMRVY